jgi:hypothetical protein
MLVRTVKATRLVISLNSIECMMHLLYAGGVFYYTYLAAATSWLANSKPLPGTLSPWVSVVLCTLLIALLNAINK